MAISRKAEVLKTGPKIVYERSYKTFMWIMLKIFYVINEEHPDTAFDEFMKLLLPIIDKHAPVKKLTVRTVKAPWIDEDKK